jgi:predicted phage terminase large subunit-like protein
MTDGSYVVEHVVRRRGTPANTERLVADTARADGVHVVQWLEQVPGAGAALVDHYKRNVCPLTIRMRGNPVKGSKGTRALPLAAAMEKHRVKFVRGPWNEPLFDEMEAFSEDPQHSGAHDDQVDAVSGGFERVRLRATQGTTSSAPALVAARLPTR